MVQAYKDVKKNGIGFPQREMASGCLGRGVNWSSTQIVGFKTTFFKKKKMMASLSVSIIPDARVM
jgi:hypothetical protein